MTLSVKGIDNAVTDLRAIADFLANHATELAAPSEALAAGRISAEATRWILGRSGALDDSWDQVAALQDAAEEMMDRLVAQGVARRAARRATEVARAHIPAPEATS